MLDSRITLGIYWARPAMAYDLSALVSCLGHWLDDFGVWTRADSAIPKQVGHPIISIIGITISFMYLSALLAEWRQVLGTWGHCWWLGRLLLPYIYTYTRSTVCLVGLTVGYLYNRGDGSSIAFLLCYIYIYIYNKFKHNTSL